MKRRFISDVFGCARCRKNHREVEFLKFAGKLPSRCSHWGLCPETGHPILMWITDTDKKTP